MSSIDAGTLSPSQAPPAGQCPFLVLAQRVGVLRDLFTANATQLCVLLFASFLMKLADGCFPGVASLLFNGDAEKSTAVSLGHWVSSSGVEG